MTPNEISPEVRDIVSRHFLHTGDRHAQFFEGEYKEPIYNGSLSDMAKDFTGAMREAHDSFVVHLRDLRESLEAIHQKLDALVQSQENEELETVTEELLELIGQIKYGYED